MEIDKKKCDYCHEEIGIESRRCSYCGSLQDLQKTQSNVFFDVDVNDGLNVNTVSDDDVYIYNKKNSLSNNMKVFLTVITSIVPGLGQIVGIIIAIIFMNSETDLDKRSFGVALLVSSIVIFAIAFLWFFVIVLVTGKMYEQFYFAY